MKKIMIVGAVAALMFTAGTAAFAANEANDTAKANAAAAAAPCYHQFVDANNDGVCDNWEAYHKDGSSYCQYGNDGYGHHRNGRGHCWNYNNGNNGNDSGSAVPQTNTMNNHTGHGHHGRGLNL